MKTNFIGAVVLCAVISLTFGSEYQYQYDNNKTCIEVKTDVMFTLTNGTETIKFDGTNFTVKSGDCALPNETAASLTLNTGTDNLLSLKFKYDAKNQSTMDAMFSFNPYEYFPGGSSPLTISIIDDGDDLLLGENKQLFQCNSSQRITLIGTLEKTKYTMYIDMSNTQIQAFGMKDGNLSTDVFVCSADQMTTSAQTTEPDTTAPSTNATTEVTMTSPNVTAQTTPTTTNATMETTTTNTTEETTTMAKTTMEGPTTAPTTAPTTVAPTPPMPPASTYEVKVGGKACLIMEGSFQLMVNKTTIIDVPSHDKVNVTGTCASGNETESSITITPTSGPLKSLTFDFKINMNSKKSELVSMSAEVMVDGKKVSSSVNSTLVLSKPKLFFKCDVGGNISDDVVTFKYEQLKVQAFNVEDEKFAENGEDCSQDVGPIPESPPVNTYSVTEGNKTCIVFKGSMQFKISYISKKNGSISVGLPEKFTVSGSCNTILNGLVSQKMEVKFYDDWNLTIYFTDDDNKTDNDQNQLTADGSGKYYISQIELEYEFNNNLFKDADDSILGTKAKFTASNLTLWETGKGKSYMCNKETTINNGGMELTVSKVQYQAFKTGKSTDFGDASECAADEETNSIVPIAVGAALAGLVIIVLIAYLIGRKRSRAGYEQV